MIRWLAMRWLFDNELVALDRKTLDDRLRPTFSDEQKIIFVDCAGYAAEKMWPGEVFRGDSPRPSVSP